MTDSGNGLRRTSTVKRRASRVGSVYSHSTSGTKPDPGTLSATALRRQSTLQSKYFAEIEFTGLNQTAKFAKIPENTPDSTIRDLLKRKWFLKPPTLIITVFGTNFEKKRKLKMIFKKGLWKAAESGCWIVTGGFNLGIMKLAGEAVRDYTDAYGGNRMMAFGVASFGCITKNDMLDVALNEGTGIYQVEEDDEDEVLDEAEKAIQEEKAKQVKTDVEECALDPNHNFFFLLDSGDDQSKHRIAETRARFERCISQWGSDSIAEDVVIPGLDSSQAVKGTPKMGENAGTQSGSMNAGQSNSATSVPQNNFNPNNIASHETVQDSQQQKSKETVDTSKTRQSKTKSEKAPDEEDIRVPMCGLIIGGDRFTLRQVYCSVIQNRCPMVVAKGTSGAADAIAFGMDTANKMAAEEAMDDKEQVPLETRLASVLNEFLGEIHPDCTSYDEEALMLAEIIKDYTALVSIFDMEDDSDLDGYMISSLLASAGTNISSEQLNLEQLEITLTLNRADIAREKIFLENKKWKKGQLNDYMYQALMSDRHDFVKLFLEQGFSLEEFLTVFMLEKLYTDQLKHMNSKVAIFNQMWEYNRSHRTSSKVALRDVGKVIKSLVGDFYHPLYLSKEFQNKLLPEKKADLMAEKNARNQRKGKKRRSRKNPEKPDEIISNSRFSISSNNNSAYENQAINMKSLGIVDKIVYIDQYDNSDEVYSTSKNNLLLTGFENHGFINIHATTGHEIFSTTRAKTLMNSNIDPDETDSILDEFGKDGQLPRSITSITTISGKGEMCPLSESGKPKRKRRSSLENLEDLPIPNQPVIYYPKTPGVSGPMISGYQNPGFRNRRELKAPLARDSPLHDDHSDPLTASSKTLAISQGCSSDGQNNNDNQNYQQVHKPENYRITVDLTGDISQLRNVAALTAAVTEQMNADPSGKLGTQDEAQTKMIQLDRPARELLIWSILVGKLRMAELFWTMEKEPIAAALLASILLNALCNKTDDFTDKEDYRSYAKNFQERAEGVLNECYREDEHRAQLIINHQLVYYGRSSVIKLAAEGQSIKFMAHPCCQDFLTNTWNGNLSTKNSAIRFILGLVFGLTMPILLPKVILYKNKVNEEKEDKEKSPDASLNATQEESMIGLNQGFDKKANKSQKSITTKAVEFIESIRDFYMAPVVRFVYHTLSYMTFLLLFSYLLLVDFRIRISPVEYIVIAWVVTLFIEEIKQICWAVLSGISFRTYISDGWNKLDCAALALFIAGFILRLIVLADKDDVDFQNENFLIITDDTLNVSRICLAISLFTFYIRLMYTFSFHIALGPKLIMIGKMVTNDLIPFMVILTVIIVGYAVASQSIAYPNGIYSNKEDMNSSLSIKTMVFQDTIFQMYTKAYFQMFGDFALDVLQGDDDDCDKEGKCPTKTSRWLIPLMLGFYVVLTNTLMFNLLIAMFSKTYEEIESASTYYWNYQRYQMIAEYVHRSPLVPPLIIFWHFVEGYNAIGNKCASITNNETVKENPFCVMFKDLKKEREMVKWEHMKAMDYLREPSQKSGGKRGGAESRAVVFRGGGGGGAVAGPGIDFKSEMTSVAEGIGMELEKRFKDIDQHFQKFTDVENRLTDLSTILNGLGDVVKHITESQEKICNQIAELPSCQCNELTDEVVEVKKDDTGIDEPEKDSSPTKPPVVSRRKTKLEMAVQAALEAAKDVLRPPTPPPPPPVMPPPVAESPMQIGLAEPSSEEDSSAGEGDGNPEADEVIEPSVSDDKLGRTLERTIEDHRLWRIYPFNFEKYPGMRMNVPADKVPWTVEYMDYFAYDSSEEALKFPGPDSHDGGNFRHGMPSVSSEHLRQIPFNQYDTKAKLRRQSLLGRYRLDPRTGAPLNPMGRTGLLGKGLLPRWGPNHAIVIVITKWMRDPRTNELVLRGNKTVLQYITLERNKRFCIPWFLVDHLNKCDLDECAPIVIKKLAEQRLRAQCSEKLAERIMKRIERADIVQLFKGYLDDQLNADSAWLETVVLNIHEGEGKGTLFPEDILKIFNEGHDEEIVKWMEVCQNTNLRTSHNYILKSVAEHRNAFY